MGCRARLGVGPARTASAALACGGARPGAGAATDSESCASVENVSFARRDSKLFRMARSDTRLFRMGQFRGGARTSGWCDSGMMRRARHPPVITGQTAVLGGRSERGFPLRSPARRQG
eukprot:14699218-Heterocapsa_arctica.AAC.1